MAYLLLTNPKLIDIMEKTKSYFFHGTNANALPSIIKYGLNSVDTSVANNIPVTTGERWSRIDGKRSFVSLTDSIDVALQYSYTFNDSENIHSNPLLNYGALIGVSIVDTSKLEILRVKSMFPEIGIKNNLPLENIKFIAVSEDKVEFVRKMVGNSPIEVISFNLNDPFLQANFSDKLSILEEGTNIKRPSAQSYPTFSQESVASVICDRKISKLHGFFSDLKLAILGHNQLDFNQGEER